MRGLEAVLMNVDSVHRSTNGLSQKKRHWMRCGVLEVYPTEGELL